MAGLHGAHCGRCVHQHVHQQSICSLLNVHRTLRPPPSAPQPSSNIYRKLDTVLLLSQGHPIFCEPGTDCLLPAHCIGRVAACRMGWHVPPHSGHARHANA